MYKEELYPGIRIHGKSESMKFNITYEQDDSEFICVVRNDNANIYRIVDVIVMDKVAAIEFGADVIAYEERHLEYRKSFPAYFIPLYFRILKDKICNVEFEFIWD